LFSGFLDPSSENEDIAVGTAVELPYWLAQSLCSRRRNIVTVEIPKIYKEAYRSVVHGSVHQVYYWYQNEK
jgi:GINS complex subunit 3